MTMLRRRFLHFLRSLHLRRKHHANEPRDAEDDVDAGDEKVPSPTCIAAWKRFVPCQSLQQTRLEPIGSEERVFSVSSRMDAGQARSNASAIRLADSIRSRLCLRPRSNPK